MAIGKIVFLGAGAIGGGVAAWTSPGYPETWCADRGETLAAIMAKGISHYEGSAGRSSAHTVRVKILEDLSVLGKDDVLVFAVKNYSLDAVAAAAAKTTGGRPLAVSMANGTDNQGILPRHFGRCAYCVIGYNAWLDEPGVIGWQSRGPLVLGTPDNSLRPELEELVAILAKGCEASYTDRLADAVHSKLIVNLVNTITTLVGHGYRPIEDIASLQRLVSRSLHEGIKVVEAAGYREYHVGKMPTWSKIRASATLPAMVTRAMFRKSLAGMVKSSMSQDVIARGGTDTELDSLTGYIVGLAAKHGIGAPYNSGLYRIAKAAFAVPGFQPYKPKALLDAVEKGGMPL